MRNWIKTILFASAFSPVLIVAGGIRIYVHGLDNISIQFFLVGLIGLTVPFIVLRMISNLSESFSIKVTKIKSSDELLPVFLVSYALPFLGFTSLSGIAIMLIVVLVMFVLYLINKITSHPVLYLFGYRFFEIESEQGVTYVFIGNRRIRNPKTIHFVKRITDAMLMEA